jgi:hypothetical protein
MAAALGSFGSLVVLAFSLRPGEKLSFWQWVLVVLAVALGLAVIAWEVRTYLVKRPWVKSPTEVPSFLRKWIADGGKAAIFSRDLSWVDTETKAVLIGKAAADELIVVLPKAIALSEELGAHGADVILYPDLAYTIKSRFTIVHLDSAGTAVAVGYRLPSGKHRIDRFHAGSNDPAFYLALDMVGLVRGYRENLRRRTPP